MSSKNPLFERAARGLLKGSLPIFIFFVGLTAIATPRAVKLIGTISTELSKLLPPEEPAVKVGNEIKKKFQKKGGGDLILLVESPDPLRNRQVMEDLARYLEKNPEVEKVRFTKDGYDFFDRHKLLYIDLEDLYTIRGRIQRKIQQEKLGGLYIDFGSVEGEREEPKDPFEFEDLFEKYQEEYKRGVKNRYYASEDETVFALWIYPRSKDSSLTFFRKFFHLIDESVEKFPFDSHGGGFQLHYAGSIRTRIDEYEALTSDLKRAGLISLVGIFLLLVFYFRSVVAVILIFIPLSSGILLGFAICSFFIKQMNVVTSFLFSILFGLGVDIGIHMYARYREDRLKGLSRDDALLNSLFRAGRSSFVAVLTTCATFFILVINDFRGFSEFGWIAGIGLLVTLLVYLLFFPSVLILAEKLKLLRIHSGSRPVLLERFFGKIKSFPRPGSIVLGGLVVMIVGAFLVPLASFEWNYDHLKIHLPRTELAREKLKGVKQRVNSPAAMIISGEVEARTLKAEYERRKKEDKTSPTIDKFRSSDDLFPTDQGEKMKLLKEIDVLLADDALNVLKGEKRKMVHDFREAIAKSETVKREEIPREIEDAFYGRGEYFQEQVAFVYPLPHLELGDGRNAVAFTEDVYEVSVGDKKIHAVSDSIVFGKVLTTLFDDSRRTIVLSVIVLALLVYLDFRNVRKSLLILGALAFGMIGMIGITVALGWKFNFYNMITIPMVIGMGEDNSVHLLHRFEELERRSVMKALSTSGMAALMASLTTLLGYAGLVFAHHPGLQSIGLFAVVGMTTCLIGSLVFLPAFLELRLARQRIV